MNITLNQKLLVFLKLLLSIVLVILISSNVMASARSTLVASTSNLNFWELWNRYNNLYYENPVLPDPGIRFKFDLASPASGLGDAYNTLNVSNDPNAIFKGAYLVTSMAAFGLPDGANLQNKTLSVKVGLKIDGANPVFLYPADEGLEERRILVQHLPEFHYILNRLLHTMVIGI